MTSPKAMIDKCRALLLYTDFSLTTYLELHLMESEPLHNAVYSQSKWSIRKMFQCNWKTIKYCICFLTPIVLVPLALSEYKEARCAYVLLWMATFWVLEPVDISVTALLPVVLMPLFGIVDSNKITTNYMKEVLMMFLGGLGVAIAVEHCNLHERIALRVLLTLGADTKWLMFGFMSTAMFLSMWISNTATTAMMVPIIEAIMKELSRGSQTSLSNVRNDADMLLLHKTLLLSVAYSANCGGTGTITGTSPNMIFKGVMEEYYPDSKEVTYASWMAYNVPGMVLCVFSAWLVLQAVYVPCWKKTDNSMKASIQKVIGARYKELGGMTFHEASVLTLFIVLVLLWIFREPKFMTGWSDLLHSDVKVGDAVPAIGILLLMFLLPSEPWKYQNSPPLLSWKVLKEKMPWGLIILLGGGYALANGTEDSGLSEWMGHQIEVLSSLPPSAVLTILCIFTVLLTEIMSNSTVTTIMLPVVNQVAKSFKVNPLYLMLPITVSASYAFMLPVATGPNAIIATTGLISAVDMIKPGIILNFITCGIQLFMTHTLGAYLFDLNTFPPWAANMTSIYITKDQILTNFTNEMDL